MFKLKNKKLHTRLIASTLIAGFMLVSAWAALPGAVVSDVSAQSSDCRPGFTRPEGADSANTGCVPIEESRAEAPVDCDEGTLNRHNCKVIDYIVIAINTLSAVVGIVVTIMIVWGAIRYSTSRDNPQETAAAKARIRDAVLAFVFYIFLYAFLSWLIPGGLF